MSRDHEEQPCPPAVRLPVSSASPYRELGISIPLGPVVSTRSYRVRHIHGPYRSRQSTVRDSEGRSDGWNEEVRDLSRDGLDRGRPAGHPADLSRVRRQRGEEVRRRQILRLLRDLDRHLARCGDVACHRRAAGSMNGSGSS